MKLKPNLAADGALVLTTVVWGSTFFMAKDILARWSPLSYMTFRFVVASLILCALFHRRLLRATREARRAGALLGALMGAGFALQAAGQVYTTASKSAFITGLTTPLVPFVAYALLRARPGVENLIGVVLATLGGLLILAPRDGGAVNLGDLLTLASTAAFAFHITLLSVYARRFDAGQITALQIVSTAALVVAAWLALRACVLVFTPEALPQFVLRESAPLVWDARVVWQLFYLSTVATVAVFFLWTWGQARTSATHAAVIFSLEPVFATLFAVAVRGPQEWLGARGFAGAGLVLAGIVVSELRWGRGGKRKGEGATVSDEG
ncbi:MAG TPA: DMT family transporter [Pyrinomonadaceae bacterium]|jgi:drug/metabolite transporter (DMT)-like permease|nr:DMT family transporter [Pyrinomonadaceae bacterium]